MPKFMVTHEAPALVLRAFLATSVGQNALVIGMRQLNTFDAYWVRASLTEKNPAERAYQ